MDFNNTGEGRRAVERSSIEKVWNAVVGEGNPITPSTIAEKVKLQVSSVRSCLELLHNLGKIEIISNGKTWLVRLKENGEVIKIGENDRRKN